MKTLLQRGDGLYYAGPGRWTTSIAEARPFADSASAIRLSVEHHMRGARLLLKFEDSASDLSIPVSSGSRCFQLPA